MHRRWLNAALLAAFLLTLALAATRSHDPAQPPWEYLPEMVHSDAAESFAPNPVFPDGKTLQEPVPRTIPQGDLPLRYETPPPEDGSPAAAARGAALYETFCALCHGSSGRGDGPVVLRGFPAPPSIVQGRAAAMNAQQLFFIVSTGWGRMPAYATQISRADRWKLIRYLRSLQSQEDAPGAVPTGAPAAAPPEPSPQGEARP